MSEAILESFTQQYLSAQPDGFPVDFTWQGGEPTLLGIDFFRHAVSLQRQYRREGQEVTNSFQTNGLLIDETWAEFFKEHDFLVGLSIDGPMEIHDCYRIDRFGNGSFNQVVEALGYLKQYGVRYNALTCVSSISTSHARDIYRFLRRYFKFIQFIPVVTRSPLSNATELPIRLPKSSISSVAPSPTDQSWSVSPEGYGVFLCDVFDEWVQHDIGRIFVQLFDITLARWVGQPASLCAYAPICGKSLAIEHDGTMYSCDHFVHPQYRLGSLLETPLTRLVDSPSQHRFGKAKYDTLSARCRLCPWLPLCGGGCPKERLIPSLGVNIGLNYLCPSYERFFMHTAPHMKELGNLVMNGLPASLYMDSYCKDSSIY